MFDSKIGFVGFGHMAQIIFHAFDQAKLVPRSHISFVRRDRLKMRENEQKFKITSTTLSHLVETSDLIFLCMRPQQVGGALTELKEAGSLEGKWVVSLLAGTKLDFLQKNLGSSVQVLRAMPNLCSSVSEGMTILSYGNTCENKFKSAATLLFGSMGEVAELPEALMDIATAIAGSGPGFVFQLIESVARTGEKHGISYAESLKMASQVFMGAAKMIRKGAMPSDLLLQIATPQGVTAAGLEMMAKNEMDHHFRTVLETAARRSRDLSES